ncbi:MAG: type I phosphomannose isomerase catalytic subunit, partial [Lachnospiraceae bacterium]
MEIIFLEPVFKQMIWGGNKLHSVFGYDIPGDDTGECWAISAHPNGDCKIKNGKFQGM